MKKIIVCIMAVALLLFGGCGQNNTAKNENSDAKTSEAKTSDTASNETPVATTKVSRTPTASDKSGEANDSAGDLQANTDPQKELCKNNKYSTYISEMLWDGHEKDKLVALDYTQIEDEMRKSNFQTDVYTGISDLTCLQTLSLTSPFTASIGTFLKPSFPECYSVMDLADISDLVDLQYLKIEANFLKNKNLSDLRGLSKLRELEIDGGIKCPIDIPDISAMENMTELEYLKIHSEEVKISDISVLAKLKKLKRFQLTGENMVKDFSALRGLPDLEVLDLELTNRTLSEISTLEGVKVSSYIHVFNFDDAGTVTCHEIIAKLEAITTSPTVECSTGRY